MCIIIISAIRRLLDIGVPYSTLIGPVTPASYEFPRPSLNRHTYVYKNLNDRKIRKKDNFHFFPFIIIHLATF